MTMFIKTTFIIVCIIFAAAFLYAGENTMPGKDPDQPRHGLVMPVLFEQYKEAVQNEIDKKNSMPVNPQQNTVKTIDYNRNGTISSVLYEDGTKFDYSYKYDEKGNLTFCSMESEGMKIGFEKRGDGKVKVTVEVKTMEPKVSTGQIVGPQGKGGSVPQKERSKPQIVLYYSAKKLKLEDVATKPIKFDPTAIASAISKAAEMTSNAREEYSKNTAVYYNRILTKLETGIKTPASDDGKLAMLVKKIHNDGISGPENRDAIDKAVESVYAEAGQGKAGKDISEFVLVEKRLREDILIPERALYEKKIEAALEYVHGMIDELVNSKLAIYLNVKTEKIDVIVNLPELNKEKK